MSTKSKRLMSLLLAMGLCLIASEALAWSWNQYPPRPYNGFDSYSPGYGVSGYGYQPAYPVYRRAYRPYYYGYGPQYRWPGYGYYRYPGYRYFPGCRY